jgi:hypothetical protein
MPTLRLAGPTCASLVGVLLLAALPRIGAAQTCGTDGVILAVSSPMLTAADSAYLQAAARALAYRWPVPSRRRESYTQWRRVRRRTLPPEPRWADDYEPAPGTRAEFRIIVPRRGKLRAEEPTRASGDDLLDRSLRLMVTDPMPASPELPPFPASVAGDSLVLTVHLGAAPDSVPSGLIRFAVAQRRVELVPGTLEFSAPRSASTPPASQRYATIKYDVNENGQIVPSSVEVLDSSDRELVDAIRAALNRARFRAAEQGCRPITMTVVQTFRG